MTTVSAERGAQRRFAVTITTPGLALSDRTACAMTSEARGIPPHPMAMVGVHQRAEPVTPRVDRQDPTGPVEVPVAEDSSGRHMLPVAWTTMKATNQMSRAHTMAPTIGRLVDTPVRGSRIHEHHKTREILTVHELADVLWHRWRAMCRAACLGS